VLIVLQDGESATAEEMIAFCRQNLAPYKVPRHVEFRAALPKTMVGKILCRVLIEQGEQIEKPG
jgi:long-chain acyl-CoA synthetase